MLKKLSFLLTLIFISVSIVEGQAPQAFKYQAVARDGQGNILPNQDISLRIKILSGTSSDNIVYLENHNLRTNQFGLINIEIGNGEDKQGSIENINWQAESYYLQVEMGELNTSTYQILGKSQFLSVPYALYAEKAGNINTKDTSTTNELQVLSFSNDTLYLSKGNFIVLPPDQINDTDHDTLNEIQSLKIIGDSLYLSEGNKVYIGKDQIFRDDSIDLSNKTLIFNNITGSNNTNLDSGLVAYYPFNGNANDESNYDNHGTVQGGASLTNDRLGNENAAYYLDGINDNINIPHNEQINFDNTGSFTVSIWVKQDPGMDTTDVTSFLCKHEGGYHNGYYFFMNDPDVNYCSETGHVCFYVSSGAHGEAYSNTRIDDNNWHHIIGIYRSTDEKALLYIDGIKQDDTGERGSSLYSPDDLNLGKILTNYWKGKINDVRIYNRVLSDEEIYSLYTPQNIIRLINTNVIVPDGNLGIGINSPQRKLHVNDVIRLEPRSTAPLNPKEGDMYMDGTTHTLKVYNGSTWQECW